jgi:hypothetical protein
VRVLDNRKNYIISLLMNFMDFYCSNCKEPLTLNEFKFSKKVCGIPLCRFHQEKFSNKHKKATPQARELHKVLVKLGIPAELEKWDGHKHIDIAVPSANINIEVDGPPHQKRRKQALADLKRDFHSFRKGYHTLRIPNILVEKELYETAKYLSRLIKAELEELEDSWEG